MRLLTHLIVIGSLPLFMACSATEEEKEAIIIKYCNERSSSMAAYAKCRCSKLTKSKSYTPEMDQCMTDPDTYSVGYAGEDE